MDHDLFQPSPNFHVFKENFALLAYFLMVFCHTTQILRIYTYNYTSSSRISS